MFQFWIHKGFWCSKWIYLNSLICVHEYIHFGHSNPLGIQNFSIHVNKLCCSNVSILNSQRILMFKSFWNSNPLGIQYYSIHVKKLCRAKCYNFKLLWQILIWRFIVKNCKNCKKIVKKLKNKIYDICIYFSMKII